MKRSIPLLFAFIFIFNCCIASAANIEPYSSLYLTKYDASVTKGYSSGKVSFTYDVRASKSATSIGVESIVIYKVNGNKVSTITGTTKNGLQKNNATRHSGTYTYSGVSGSKYYAKITLFAKSPSGTSSKTITTATVTAP